MFLLGLMATVGLTAHASAPIFTPGQLAVLQEGTGGTNRNVPLGATANITFYAADDVQGCRQTQLFVDQFDPAGINQTNPQVQVAIPTNDATGGLFVNGNAGTEGGMTLSGDKSELALCGYSGTMLSITTGGQTAPSNLSYNRGIATLDAFTNYTRVYSGGGWYGIATGKTNPRGVATDGQGNFWGCGNGYGSLYFNAATTPSPIQFQNVDLTSCIKVINNAVYTSVKAGDVQNGLYPAGLYTFVDDFFNPVPYPTFLTFLQQYLPATAPFTNCIGFDINPQGTVAYVADVGSISKTGVLTEPGGIQKYVQSGSGWALAYNLEIPGYWGLNSGINTNAASTNNPVGCFSVTVDWSGTNPVVYATTADCGIDPGDPYYGNRVIRINDTNTVFNGRNIMVTTNMNILTTVARPGRDLNGSVITNVIYKSVTFTPDLRPVIAANPANWTATVGNTVNFSVTATSAYTLGYQWLSNGVAISSPSASTTTLTLSPVDLTYNNTTYQCVVTNVYGAITSSIATLLVYSSAQAPSLGALLNQTNYIGSTFTLSANATGTDPKSFQWYLNGTMITDGPVGDNSSYTGTTNSTLTISDAQSGEAGVYSVLATNIAGQASNSVVNLTVTYPAPAIVVPPAGTTAFLGTSVGLTVSAYDGTVNGASLTYTWYSSKSNGTVLTPLASTGFGEYSGATASGGLNSTLTINPTVARDATNYVVVVSNSGGSVTSAPVALTLVAQPAHSFVSYTNISAVYAQNFNSLPVNGGTSADAANPVAILVVTNSYIATNNSLDPGVVGLSATYSLNNPFDFAYPVIAQGNVGGLGLSSMAGWYGWSSGTLKFGATYGDQSTGGIIDNGFNYLGDGTPLTSITNRSLGMIATTKTEYVAYGVALINKSGTPLANVNIRFTGELWRNNPAQQVVNFSYAIDAAGTNSTFNPGTPTVPGSLSLTAVPNLNIAFPTAVGTTINDGTQPANQLSLATNNMTIASWPTNAALWLIWESANPQGGAQAIAIDNLSFSATPALATVTPPVLSGVSYAQSGAGAGLQFGFANTPGASWQFTVWGTTNLALPFSQWQNLGQPSEVSAGNYQFTDGQATNKPARFYKVTAVTQ